jgi:protein import protein ZIM17
MTKSWLQTFRQIWTPFVMLPSRLFRNTGLAPPLRSLITPHASLPASVSVQLRFRLKVRAYSASTSTAGGPQAQIPASNSSVSSSSANANDSSPAGPSLSAPLSSLSQSSTSHTHRLQTDPLEPRLSITFTCTVPNCSTRSSHTFTKRAYEKGVVIVQCPGCKNRWACFVL